MSSHFIYKNAVTVTEKVFFFVGERNFKKFSFLPVGTLKFHWGNIIKLYRLCLKLTKLTFKGKTWNTHTHIYTIDIFKNIPKKDKRYSSSISNRSPKKKETAMRFFRYISSDVTKWKICGKSNVFSLSISFLHHQRLDPN